MVQFAVAGLGSNLRREVKAAVARIVANPEWFGVLEDDVRCCPVHRFPYGILYEIRPDRVLIVFPRLSMPPSPPLPRW